MLLPSDEISLQQRGISKQQIEEQLQSFVTGFPFLKIKGAASIGNGLIHLSEDEQQKYLAEWEDFQQTDASVLKFVPASGAASRMFKALFAFLDSEDEKPEGSFEKKFFDGIEKFAFYDDLNDACLKNEDKTIPELIETGKFKDIISDLLNDNGLNYGSLPKGLLKFHSYTSEKRTPLQEHLVEGALYASTSGKVNIHFTVSGEHRELFEKHLNESLPAYEKKYSVKYNVSFSEQKPSTDTIAVDTNNKPFRENGKLVFRPGGHGALISNLNDLDFDVIFIKNIDNVVPDNLKDITVKNKKLIAGILVNLQKQAFAYLKELENEQISDAKLAVITQFCETKLNNHHPNIKSLKGNDLRQYLVSKLNRPIRVCGMVKNEGEPGGGPFLTVNQDGTVSPQILESSQIDQSNPEDKAKMMNSSHFNPVDLVCGVKNYKGEKFDLLKHVDKNTGFISLKSKSGRELKALELPGLWNGAMSDWNTVFVEVPIETFNPVKTVNDLLRKEHQ
ncbi:MAG: DUF4301 family protein [Bacteroidales bacterium]|nr:DUF4301 family protein [Bacteroidales bacterium]